MKGFRERTLSGAFWSVTSQTGRQAILILSNVVLARLLTPRDFGLTATALIFVNFAVILAEQGFGAALIQRKEVTEDHLSSIFWVNVALGLGFSVLFLAGAPLIAALFHEEALIPLTRVIALIFAINSLGMVQSTMLTRDLAFKSLAKAEIAAAWIGGVVAIALAWRGWGPMSIAIQAVVTSIVGVVILWRVGDFRPSARFRWSAVRDLSEISSNSFIANITHYWVRNVDNVLIGFFLGQGPLGVYTRAYSVLLFPLNRVSRVLSRVMFPSLAMIQDDLPRVRGVYLKISRVIALVTFPLMIGVAASAENFTAVVFGPQWGEMVPVLRILAIVGMVQSVTSLAGNLYLARNQTAHRLRVIMPIQALQVLGIVVGLKWGIYGVAVGYAAASLVGGPIDCHFAGRLVGLSLARFSASLSGVFACAAAMGLAVAGLGALLPPGLSPFAAFALQVTAGVAVYAGLLHAFSIEGYDELRALVRGRFTSGRSA